MSVISQKELQKLAHVSRIAFDQKELLGVSQQIEQVIEYVRSAKQVSSDVQDTYQKNQNITRQDQVVPSTPEIILGQAPERADRFFVVPAILEHA